jgi:hypothetical protein
MAGKDAWLSLAKAAVFVLLVYVVVVYVLDWAAPETSAGNGPLETSR